MNKNIIAKIVVHAQNSVELALDSVADNDVISSHNYATLRDALSAAMSDSHNINHFQIILDDSRMIDIQRYAANSESACYAKDEMPEDFTEIIYYVNDMSEQADSFSAKDFTTADELLEEIVQSMNALSE